LLLSDRAVVCRGHPEVLTVPAHAGAWRRL